MTMHLGVFIANAGMMLTASSSLLEKGWIMPASFMSMLQYLCAAVLKVLPANLDIALKADLAH